VLNEGTLVLEGVTLAEVVELVVEVLVNLSAGTVLDKKAAEDTLAAHPKDLTARAVSTWKSMTRRPSRSGERSASWREATVLGMASAPPPKANLQALPS
jgi:hypothetical protein